MKLLFNPGYCAHIEVSAELLEKLLACPVYEQKYEKGCKYYLIGEDYAPEIKVIKDSDFATPTVQTIDIDFIMEENNRLTRELDRLKEKLKPVSVSTELEPIE